MATPTTATPTGMLLCGSEAYPMYAAEYARDGWTLIHSRHCKAAFGRLDWACARCCQLGAGAQPRGSGHREYLRRKLEAVQRRLPLSALSTEPGLVQRGGMSAPRRCDGVAPHHRERLGRTRRSAHFEFRLGIYEKLLQLGRVDAQARPEPAVAIVERLILDAHAETLRRLPAATQ